MNKVLFLMVFALLCNVVNATTSERYIIESEDLANLESEIKIESGFIVRPMQAVKGLVVYLPTGAISKLNSRISGLKITRDVEMYAISNEATIESSVTLAQRAQSIPWGIRRIKAREANLISRGDNIKVCVVDTGIDSTHPDLMSNIVGGRNFVRINGSVNRAKWNDDHGHGTHVSGIIASLDNAIGVVGVAPNAKLYAVKVLNRQGSGYLSDVADGVKECVRARAQVINMSLSATANPNYSSPLKTAILNAQSAGAVVVVAAGNDGENIANTIPAGYSFVIAVGATNSSDQITYWSNFGLGSNDFVAPGASIYSTWKGGGYSTYSGTSMASPHVAGVVALYLSSPSSSLKAVDLGFSMSLQGLGLIDALGSVK